RAVGIKHLLFGERGNALERVGIFADIVPGEDSAVGNGVVRNEAVEVKVGQTRSVAIPLIRDPAGEVLEDPELEVHSRVEWTVGPPQKPSLPVRVLVADGGNVFALGDVPARAVKIPALVDGDDFAELPTADDFAHLVLIGAAQPLRAHLHNLSAVGYRLPSQLRVLESVG